MIKTFSITIFLLLSVMLSGAQSIDELIDSGNQKIKGRDFEGATADFKQALELDAVSSLALNGIIRACTLSENYKEAQKYVEIAVNQFPQNPEFVLRHGILLNFMGKAEEAINEFEKGLTMEADSRITLQLLMNKASAELNLDSFNNAIDDYTKAIDIEPRNTNIYNCRGLANYRAGNFQDAVTDYTNALDLDPSLTLPYYNRALALLKMNDKQKACVDLQRACRAKIGDACKRIVLECKRN